MSIMDINDKIVISIMILNFFFWIAFGTLSFLLYVYLLGRIFYHDLNKELLDKYIRIFSFLSVFPTATLIAILIVSIFHLKALWVFIMFIHSGYPLSVLTIVWIMPPIFLMIKPFISKKSYFYKFFIIWFGVVSFCSFCSYFAFILY